jgi:hypothetical protein
MESTPSKAVSSTSASRIVPTCRSTPTPSRFSRQPVGTSSTTATCVHARAWSTAPGRPVGPPLGLRQAQRRFPTTARRRACRRPVAATRPRKHRRGARAGAIPSGPRLAASDRLLEPTQQHRRSRMPTAAPRFESTPPSRTRSRRVNPSQTSRRPRCRAPGSSDLNAEPVFGGPIYLQRVEPLECRSEPVDEVDRREVGQ